MCDTFVVVSPDRVLFGKNSDRDPNEAQVLSWVPAESHEAGATLRCTWVDIPQSGRTNAVVLSRPFWMWGAEMGANEHGVVIGNEAIFAREALDDDGLLGMDLVRLGLERADTATAAKDVICELIVRHGQGGRCGYDNARFSYHNSFLIADPSGAWVVEAAGRRTAAHRVDDGVYAISNGITRPELLSLEDRIRPRVAMASQRRQRVACLAESAREPVQAMNVLRDHGDGNASPRYRRVNGAMAAPCMHAGGWLAASQTVGSFVADLGQSARQFWATGTAAPCLGVFRPVSVNLEHDVGEPTGERSSSLWWRFESLHRALLAADLATVDEYRRDRDRLQAELFELHEAAAWEMADAWLEEWRQRIPLWAGPDRRPPWLRRYWHKVERQSIRGTRLPWRPARDG
jgi:secernin